MSAHKTALLLTRARQNKNDSILSKNSNLEIAAIFHHPHGEGKSEGISKLDLFLD